MTRWLWACLALGASACDECDVGDSRCDGQQRLVCVQPSPAGGAPTRAHWEEIDCGRPDLCIADVGVEAFCAIAADPDPACPDVSAVQVACADTDRLTCRAGYPIERDRCAVCEQPGAVCQGGYGDACSSPGDCVAGLDCLSSPDRPTPHCTRPCSCRDFAYCDECRLAGEEQPFSSVARMCDQGVCVP